MSTFWLVIVLSAAYLLVGHLFMALVLTFNHSDQDWMWTGGSRSDKPIVMLGIVLWPIGLLGLTVSYIVKFFKGELFQHPSSFVGKLSRKLLGWYPAMFNAMAERGNRKRHS